LAISSWGFNANSTDVNARENDSDEAADEGSSSSSSIQLQTQRSPEIVEEDRSRPGASSSTVRKGEEGDDDVAMKLSPVERLLQGALLDPLRFSYYLSANIPLQDKQRQKLLEAENVIVRLK
jgi:hypothetical protein